MKLNQRFCSIFMALLLSLTLVACEEKSNQSDSLNCPHTTDMTSHYLGQAKGHLELLQDDEQGKSKWYYSNRYSRVLDDLHEVQNRITKYPSCFNETILKEFSVTNVREQADLAMAKQRYRFDVKAAITTLHYQKDNPGFMDARLIEVVDFKTDVTLHKIGYDQVEVVADVARQYARQAHYAVNRLARYPAVPNFAPERTYSPNELVEIARIFRDLAGEQFPYESNGFSGPYEASILHFRDLAYGRMLEHMLTELRAGKYAFPTSLDMVNHLKALFKESGFAYEAMRTSEAELKSLERRVPRTMASHTKPLAKPKKVKKKTKARLQQCTCVEMPEHKFYCRAGMLKGEKGASAKDKKRFSGENGCTCYDVERHNPGILCEPRSCLLLKRGCIGFRGTDKTKKK